MMKKVLFRADAHPSLGIGDLMSLIHLSDYFIADGWECEFLIKEYTAGKKLLEKYGLENVHVLDKNISIDNEIKIINSLIKDYAINLIFFEITERKLSDYQGLSKQAYKACVSFDGKILPDMDLVIDWDVDAHRFFNPEKYPQTLFLLGPEYVILPFNFSEERITGREYRIPPRKLLVSMGGADELNFTQKVINTLINHHVNIKIVVTIGSGYKYGAELENSLRESRLHFEIHENTTNMFDQYINCDMAIGAGGLTASELVATRTPAMLIAVYEHQIARCKFFDSQGYVKFTGYRAYDENDMLKKISDPHIPEQSIPFNTRSIVEACDAIIQ